MEGSASLQAPGLLALDNPASRAVHAIIQLAQRQRGTWLAPRVVRVHSPEVGGAPARGGCSPGPLALHGPSWGRAQVAEFNAALVEDSNSAGVSYMEQLCAIHQKIQNSVG